MKLERETIQHYVDYETIKKYAKRMIRNVMAGSEHGLSLIHICKLY